MQLNGFFRRRAWLWRERRRNRSAMPKLNMVTNEVYKVCLNKITSQKKIKQNLGMPEDNLKSIVQAFFLLTREMLCKRFD